MERLMDEKLQPTRRHFFGRAATGIGVAALAQLLGRDLKAATGGLPGLPHFAPKAKRVIYLFQSGGPSQIELFDYKPRLQEFQGHDLPDSVRAGQRLTQMSATQSSFPMVPSRYSFKQHGESGAWISELLPHTARIADDLTFVKSVYTEAINHDPAVTYLQTGAALAGRPSMGSWVVYGLGAETQDLPGFVVMISPGAGGGGQPLYDRLWGSGFLPTRYQGVKFRSVGDPVLYLSDPAGFPTGNRREYLDALKQLNTMTLDEFGDPEVATRIAQYEMAFKMQSSVPELTDLSKETAQTFESYGPDSKKPGTFAYNCLLARRLAERGVRFIQLYHRDWDHHANLPKGLPKVCEQTDQPAAALVADLKQRGMLDDTLVIWGGEFGRTPTVELPTPGSNQGKMNGRDHNHYGFTMWLAGGGVKRGHVHGATDEFGFQAVEDKVHVHDLHATILHLLGFNHETFTYRHAGRDFRLTDVHGQVVKDILA
jgi:hypothetical protein